jgi:GNAT superfamily N-acetyltransferase
MSFIIRRARNSDVDGIAGLVKLYWEFEQIEGFDRSRIATLLRDFLGRPEGGYCWIADGDRGLVGYLLAVTLFSLEHGGTMAEIDELFVVPDARSAGIGAALLRTADQDLGAAGVVRLQLQLGVNNLRAETFYGRHGFQPRGGYQLMDKPMRGSAPHEGPLRHGSLRDRPLREGR